MGRILNFIIIDEFNYRRQGSVYFLTHWHSDHYQGICNTWPYGKIYCSPTTRRLLLSRFPKLKPKIECLKYNCQNLLTCQILSNSNCLQKITLPVRIYDSNHMAGSIMILISYNGKYYLHTGDMRFNRSVAENNNDLFTRTKDNQYICNYHIHKLFLDNTFCDPIFMFPPRSYALKLLVDIINQYKPKKVFICTDSVGKQQAFVYLSKKYKCKVKVSQDRLAYIKCMGIDYKNHFTLKDSWLQSIRKGQKQQRVSLQKQSISIMLTGWANLNSYHPIGYNSFVVPYSLHSNYNQIQTFVRWIRPQEIIPIVYHKDDGKETKFRQKIGSYEGYMMSLCYLKQRGLKYLKETYETKQKNYPLQSSYKNHNHPLQLSKDTQDLRENNPTFSNLQISQSHIQQYTLQKQQNYVDQPIQLGKNDIYEQGNLYKDIYPDNLQRQQKDI